MAYFLVSVSNRTNLNLCIKYALAGFTNSINGLWTFVEIQEGDFISFLYGARVFNLYRVKYKIAYKNAEDLPPWPPVTFKMSGKTYCFPFRLYLEPIRELDEPMVRPEFAYVAENLLLRGGYRKTHFQADFTTFYAVSQMGHPNTKSVKNLVISDHESFSPALTWNKNLLSPPEIFPFQELILQSIIRHYLSDEDKLQVFLENLGLKSYEVKDFEVLGEKALPEGHIDIFIKDSHPKGKSRKIIIEVKTGSVKLQDTIQLKRYMDEIEECVSGALIVGKASRNVLRKAQEEGISLFVYHFKDVNKNRVYSFEVLRERFYLKH